jgi:GNAT superfamily N-acetyltransferase
MKSIPEMFELYATERGFGPRLMYARNTGFAIYHIKDSECYIEELFVLKEQRRYGAATEIADEIAQIAKENNCHILTGSVVASANGADISRAALLSYGFKLFEESDGFEKYSKEI